MARPSGSESSSGIFVDYSIGRDSWWKGHLRDTPIPGAYEVTDFIQELDAVKISKTYGFKSNGRKISADPTPKGKYLMPGLYHRKNFIDENFNKKQTYSFKSIDRENRNGLVIGVQDKHMLNSDISPVKYASEYKPVETLPSKHSVFKSQSQRFPTIYFKPKEGPSPSQYDIKSKKGIQVTSAFASKTPRFKKVHVLKTPGPGAHTKMLQYPMPKHIREVGRYHGVFFPPGVY